MTIFIESWSDEDANIRAAQVFESHFHAEPTGIYAAPGRVNLIGEHTDYNSGLCLPIALPHRTFAAYARRSDDVVRFVSDGGTIWSGRIGDLGPQMARSWVNYPGGVAWALGIDHGFDIAIASCVPVGAGLSSSAALECAVAIALTDGTEVSQETLVEASIRAENEVAHAPTGGMDQSIAIYGEAKKALALDFRSGERTQIPVEFAAANLALLVVDTRAHHALTDGQYGSRRDECNEAARLLGIGTLREARLADVEKLPDLLGRRVRHIVTENARVEGAINALRKSDFVRLGELLTVSHTSMRDDFEISAPELDLVVDTALVHGALGARMTGGGFGGSAIALVNRGDLDRISNEIDTAFADAGYRVPRMLIAQASDGAAKLDKGDTHRIR